MIPVLARIGPLDVGDGLLVLLAAFVLTLSWRWVVRALGEEVPPLTVTGVLLSFLGAIVVAAAVVIVVNHVGPVEIRAYGLMLVLGFTAATAWCIHDGSPKGYPATVFLDLVLYLLVGSLVGSRLGYVLLDWKNYASDWSRIFAFWEGGLSFHGGVIGGILGGALYAWRSKQSFWRLADIVAPGIALGYAFGRVGCFLNGCCYGHPTDLPWGVVFPGATSNDGQPLTVPVHPTQLYGILATLAIFWALVGLSKVLRHPGHVMGAYLVLYSVYRFFIEYLRRGATAAVFSPIPSLTLGQVASLVVGILALTAILATWPQEGQTGGQ